MSDTTVLRTTKIGGGFVKEDVMQYLDQLNDKMIALQEENARFKEAFGENDLSQIKELNGKITKLQEENARLRKESEKINEKSIQYKSKMESLTTHLQSELDKSKAELNRVYAEIAKIKPAEKTSGVILHNIPEETNSDDFRKDVMESLGRIESELLKLHIESLSGGGKE